MTSRRATLSLFAALSILPLALTPLAGQTRSPSVSHAYGRSRIVVGTAWAQPGGVLSMSVKNARWPTANAVLDGRRGVLSNETGALFGLMPVSLDAEPTGHKLSFYFPGGRGRGGVSSLMVLVTASERPGRTRTLSAQDLALVSSRTAIGHGRFLLRSIRNHDPLAHQLRPLSPPVSGPISFPFGGIEDFGVMAGPSKDGLMGEQHRGVDYEVPVGTPVSAPGSGVVLLARELFFSGKTVVVDHGRGLVSVLSRLNDIKVMEESLVAQGEVVGTSGSTGFGALAPHVCFSVYLHSINVDPAALMDPGLWTPAS